MRIFTILFLVCLSLNIRPDSVKAFPPLPSSFYGTIKLNGANVADGTLVEAVVNGKVVAQSYTQMYEGDSVYTISVPGDDASTSTTVEGAKEGDAISFKIGGIAAGQAGAWRSGTNVKLDLSATASAPPNTPAPTRTPFPTQTAIPTQVTPQPTYTLAPYPTQTQALVINTEPAVMTTPVLPASPAALSTAIEKASQTMAAGTEQTALNDETLIVQSEKTAEQEVPGANPSRNWIIILGTGILLALVVAGWLFIRQMRQ